MRKICLFLLLIVPVYSSLNAQTVEHCAAMEKVRLFGVEAAFEKSTGVSIKNRSSKTGINSSGKIIIIPVVVHVLYQSPEQNISDDVINLQMNILNRDYRRTNTDTTERILLS